jgi:hypothetical protein
VLVAKGGESMTRIRSLYGMLLLLFAFAIAGLLGAPAWAAYVIYVQGTVTANPFKTDTPITSIFNGSFNAGNTVQEVSYPATIGLLNLLTYKGGYGLLPPTLNRSVAIGAMNLDAIIKADQAANPKQQIYVIGYSQGAIVGTVEALALQAQGPSAYKNVTFILPGNPDRLAAHDGGIAPQIPIPIPIPGVLTIGGGVLSTPPPTNGPTIVDVTNQGDPFANFSFANPLGFISGLFNLLAGNPSPHDYTNTDITPAMISGTDPYPTGDVVTQTGNLTDVFIPGTTPTPAPHQRPDRHSPVNTFQLVSAPMQSGSSRPKLTLPVAASEPSVSTPNPVAVQRPNKPPHH